MIRPQCDGRELSSRIRASLLVLCVVSASTVCRSVSVTNAHDGRSVPCKVLLPFCENGLWGYIDESGIRRVKPQFEYAGDFTGGFAQVIRGDTISFLDNRGTRAFDVPFARGSLDWVGDFSEGFAWFSKGGKCGCLNSHGRVAIMPSYDDAAPFHDGMARINTGAVEQFFPFRTRVGGKWGYVHSSGALAARACQDA